MKETNLGSYMKITFKNFIFITTDIHYDVTVKLSQDFDKMEIYLHFMKGLMTRPIKCIHK